MTPPLSRRELIASAAAGAAVLGVPTIASARISHSPRPLPVTLSDAEWRRRLSPMAYYVLRQEGTERPHSSPLNREQRRGRFGCAGCGELLFSSATKFDSGAGWPSFYAPLPRAVTMHIDRSLGFARTEVACGNCGGHLGHVFEDGPAPTGLRYCTNGAALVFTPV